MVQAPSISVFSMFSNTTALPLFLVKPEYRKQSLMRLAPVLSDEPAGLANHVLKLLLHLHLQKVVQEVIKQQPASKEVSLEIEGIFKEQNIL